MWKKLGPSYCCKTGTSPGGMQEAEEVRGMNFDKKEKYMDVMVNKFLNSSKKLEWLEKEIQLHEEKIAVLKSKIFFTLIDRYLESMSVDELTDKITQEFVELNP